MKPAPKPRRPNSPAAPRSAATPAAFAAFVAAGFAIAVGIWFRTAYLDVPELTPDEQYYAHYGYGLLHHGFADVAATLAHYNATPQLWQFPSPARIGPTLVSALVIAISGSDLISNVALFSTLLSILALPLLFWIAYRRFGAWAAAFAVLFLATSPLELAVARRAWQEASLAFISLGLLGTYARLLERPAHRGWLALFALLGMGSLLFKESMGLVLGLGTIGLALHAWRTERTPRAALPPIVAGIAAVLGALGLLVLACGGVAPLVASLSHLFVPGPPNVYLEKYQRGSIAYYLVGLGLLDPLPWILGVLATLLIVARSPLVLDGWNHPTARPLLQSLGWFTLVFEVLAVIYPQKNIRFLAPLWPCIYLLAGALLGAALARVRAQATPSSVAAVAAVLGALLVVSSMLALRRFVHFFVDLQIGDLATPWFTGS